MPKIALTGRMNKAVYRCLDCDFKAPHYSVVPYMLGVADSAYGEMVVWECPECFSKWFFHSRGNRQDSYPYEIAHELYSKGVKDWYGEAKSIQRRQREVADQELTQPKDDAFSKFINLYPEG